MELFFQRSTFYRSSSILCHHPHEKIREEPVIKTRPTLIFQSQEVVCPARKEAPPAENYVSNAVIQVMYLQDFLFFFSFFVAFCLQHFPFRDRSTNVLLLLPLIIHRTAVVLVE